MADFKLDRIRFKWQDAWNKDRTYVKDDIVIFNGKAYVCLVGHLPVADFYTDLNADPPKWELMFDGFEWKGEWTSETVYAEGDIIKWKGYLYQCIEGHTSTVVLTQGPIADSEKWRVHYIGRNWLNEWVENEPYDLGDVITYNGITYVCNTKHRANADIVQGLEADLEKWTILNRSDNWLDFWRTGVRYIKDDVIRYGAITYRCLVGHTSAADAADGLEADSDKWEIVVEGIEYLGDWQESYRYKLNDIVKSNHALWRCQTEHTSSTSLRVDESNWLLWLPGIGYEELWDISSEYKKGDIVLYGGYSYIALTNNTGSVPSINGILQDTGDWELFTQGYNHRGDWTVSESYLTGDVIRNNGYLYVAIKDSSGIYPDTDATTWELLVPGDKWRAEWADATEYFLGDIVTYAGTAYHCIARHTSDSSDARPDLDVQQDDQDYWVVLLQGKDTNVLTFPGDIRTHDGTETVRLPIGNIGDALKVQSDSNISWQEFENVTNVYYVADTGTDTENSGRTLNNPFRTIKYACEYLENNINKDYVKDWNYIAQVVTDLIADGLASGGDATTSQHWDTNPGLVLLLLETYSSRLLGDVDNSGALSTADATALQNYGSGSLSDTSDEYLWIESRLDYRITRNPRRFAPVTFSQVPENVTLFIKTGIYQEALPIKVPRNVALVGDELRGTTIQPAPGYETSNMFFVNNGSGIRNMTLQGLAGEFTELNDYGTRRVTAGAFVSLDPGQGPDDESVWIDDKSPYVQNVTTFGSKCIGMKIDGFIHNGGNRSIVANDFTQVLSDGIGYWASNRGRSELVSVFTYFCYIGYLTTDGGVLRGTNGNNSYGTYGSRAEGFAPWEDPISAVVDNQSTEASVAVVHTTGSEILGVGYTNAGQEYTNASIDIRGGGIDVDAVYDEYRSEAIAEMRVTSEDSSIPGGLNYQYLLNNAQGGTDKNIILAAADTSGTNEAYEGMRIFIESGAGAGQYGVISYYDSVSKRAIISKEVDGSEGWEHFVPGYPIASVLDSTTRYSLEPRIEIDRHNFVPSQGTIPDGFIPHSISYGDGTWYANGNSPTGAMGYAVSTDNGDNWTVSTTYGTNDPSKVVWTGQYFLFTRDNETWDISYLYEPGVGASFGFLTAGWNSTLFSDGEGRVYAVVARNNAYRVDYSDDHGATWNESATTLAGTVGLTGPYDYWVAGAAGAGLAIAIADDGAIATSDDYGVTWTNTTPLSAGAWYDIAYGNGIFVAVGQVAGTTRFARSFDGVTWYEEDLITPTQFDTVNYSGGQFVSFGGSSTEQENTLAFSKGGNHWQLLGGDSTALQFTAPGMWSDAAGDGTNWMFIQNNASTFNIADYGTQAFARAKVESSRVTEIRVYDPGSSYSTPPNIFIADPIRTIAATVDVRMGNNVLPQPIFVNRGQGYTTASATITGDGFADSFQIDDTLVLKNVTRLPGPGDNVRINGIDDVIYRVTNVTGVTGTEGNYSLTLDISPSLGVTEAPIHEEDVEIRQFYSQIRITGHDFLDIGTGNSENTRYPELYLEGEDALNARQPFNEVTEIDGGRVFYTSTDQDGNFRVGELFKVEQSTGIVSVNASYFDLQGLTELALGGIQVGGTAVVVREFSKDGTMSANSNNIVPTQAAIIKYLESKISGGGSDATTNTLIAGQVKVSSNYIDTTSDNPVVVKPRVTIRDGVDGSYLTQMLYAAGGAT